MLEHGQVDWQELELSGRSPLAVLCGLLLLRPIQCEFSALQGLGQPWLLFSELFAPNGAFQDCLPKAHGLHSQTVHDA